MCARVLVAAQLLTGVPAMATPQEPAPPARPPSRHHRSSQCRAPNRVRRIGRSPPVELPPSLSSLPISPTDAELTRARIFPEPLVPMQRPTTREENAALAQAIKTCADAQQGEMVAPLVAFLTRYPDSAWRPSLLANLGTVYRAHGYLSRALNAWNAPGTRRRARPSPARAPSLISPSASFWT